MENSSGPIANGVGGGVKRCWSARAGSWIRSSQHSRSIGTMCAARRTERLEIAVLKLQSVFTDIDQDLVTNFDMLRLLEEKGRSENSQEEHTIMKSNTEVWNQLNETQATVIEEEQGEAMEVAEDDEHGLQAHGGDHGVQQEGARPAEDALRGVEEEDDLVVKRSDKNNLSNIPVYWAKETNHRSGLKFDDYRVGDGGAEQVREEET